MSKSGRRPCSWELKVKSSYYWVLCTLDGPFSLSFFLFSRVFGYINLSELIWSNTLRMVCMLLYLVVLPLVQRGIWHKLVYLDFLPSVLSAFSWPHCIAWLMQMSTYARRISGCGRFHLSIKCKYFDQVTDTLNHYLF